MKDKYQYLLPIILFTIIIVFLAGCPESGGSILPSEPPNEITGPATIIQIASSSDIDNPLEVYLIVEGAIDLEDPITFKYSVSSNTNNIPLSPPIFDFNEVNGMITLTWDIAYEGMFVDLDFWTERGVLQSAPYTIRFFFKFS